MVKPAKRAKESLPNIPLVEIHAVLSQEHYEFLLERKPAVVFFLVADVLRYRCPIRLADAESAVARLPGERATGRPGLMHPS